ncbi:hypothetical protein LPJ63_002681 [Coemansia sp. RSA 2711]|nr:hypothetical protein LPJ63_002681 [Coemansia sp. RSA 2711]KAJ1842365.1 hypothetical protein LPJ70_003845 [Coemansia sp. RSA 2708]KAJ2304329.1 hypothetical protein IWW52_006621 [Coemansia sp. RSA 2704]KAJ2313118.1 hypothetical protein IWW54_001706 [Coemansia sp. RSA 2705]KAJ2367010.1 hypothetical protein H4S01_002393 [Coemansia sp. RSA 2610]KAJ2390061.1 hypothetical protein H4S02_002056 [Coemansia sp. RSA 2611]KAJ2710676.1 hypothetical protein H4R23_006534 [Coemansia sp. Cherry 401B]
MAGEYSQTAVAIDVGLVLIALQYLLNQQASRRTIRLKPVVSILTISTVYLAWCECSSFSLAQIVALVTALVLATAASIGEPGTHTYTVLYYVKAINLLGHGTWQNLGIHVFLATWLFLSNLHHTYC